MDFTLFGLDNRDKRIYEALLISPRSSLRSIAGSTGINRGSVYESVKALQAAGLVSYIQTGERKKYQAEPPECLHDIVDERRQQLRKAHTTIDAYTTKLQIKGMVTTIPQFAQFYEGDEGTATILRDVLAHCRRQQCDEYYVVSSPRVSTYMYERFPHYTSERIRQGLCVKVLRQGPPVRGEAKLAQHKALHVPGDSGTYLLIYGDKVATLHIGEMNHLSAVVIHNSGVAAAHRAMFEQAWESVAA